jgi:phospholipase A1
MTSLHRNHAGIGAWMIIACTASASAAAAPTTVADCHEIAGETERLACYDRATGRETVNAPAPAAATPPPAASAPAPKQLSIIDTAWAFDPSTSRNAVRLYRPNYILPIRYSDRPNNAPFTPLFEAEGVPPQNLDNNEAKFQLSFKARLWATDDRRFGVWGAYTQQSQWQVYNDKGVASRPFRETDFQPELFMSYRPDIDLPGGFSWKVVNAGFIHQSNGRSEILSRSWNRLFAEGGVERGDLAVVARAWYRIKESEGKDDNADITDFLGHAEIDALYHWNGHSFHIGGRGNLSTHKGAVRAGWTTPPLLGPFRGYVQVFSGYGESLIDYNWKQSTIGIGIALNDGL